MRQRGPEMAQMVDQGMNHKISASRPTLAQMVGKSEIEKIP